jgi:hypothetical protein
MRIYLNDRFVGVGMPVLTYVKRRRFFSPIGPKGEQ